MKLVKIFFILLALTCFNVLAQNTYCPIIPAPANVVTTEGYFKFDNTFSINVKTNFKEETTLFKAIVAQKTGVKFKSLANKKSELIVLLNDSAKDSEAYQLKISQQNITLIASSKLGVHNGLMSLAQLVANNWDGQFAKIPNCTITDEPRYKWRGLMLDEARHFFGVNKVKQILDWLAYYKINKFHWHLTDEQGWRLAITKYPKLALIGGTGNKSNPNAEAKFYTQQQISDIVSYANQRKIEIIPEIDMPGHATAANKAYPEFSGGGTDTHPEFTFNPGNGKTYSYLTDILREVKDLFKATKIHLGADEVAFGAKAWETNKDVQNLMAQNNLKGIDEVENYFVKRMADSITKLNAKVLAWDEALSANLNQKNTILFWWRHDKPQQLQKALNQGYQVVLCPRLPMYFDFVQDEKDKLGRKWSGKFNSVLDVYQFPGNLAEANNSLVLGLQANLWTETIYNVERLDYMIFPRLAALAEAGWTKQELKDGNSFLNRLKNEMKYYKAQNLYYFDQFNELDTKRLENPKSKADFNYVDPMAEELKKNKKE